MKKRLLAVVALAAVGWLIDGALAAQPPGGAAKDKKPEDRAKELHERLIKDLELTEKQAAPVRKVLDGFRADMAAWMRKNGPEIEKLRMQMRLIHQGKHRGSIQEARVASDRLRKLIAEQKAKEKGLITQLEAVLSDKQLAKARAILYPPPPLPPRRVPVYLLKRIGLTKAQWLRIRTIMDEARVAQAHEGLNAKGGATQGAWDRIVKEVLTEKDRKKLAAEEKASRRRVMQAMLGGVKLSEEQFTKIYRIWKEAEKEGAKNPQQRFAIFTAAHKKIVDTVLTPEQRKQMQKSGGSGMHKLPSGGAGKGGKGEKAGPGHGR